MRHELVQGRPGHSGGWRVATYLIRRLGASVVILSGISIFIFALLHIVFPSPALIVLGVKASPPLGVSPHRLLVLLLSPPAHRLPSPRRHRSRGQGIAARDRGVEPR